MNAVHSGDHPVRELPSPPKREERLRRGLHATQLGILANVVLVLVKLISGLIGNSYALIADALESGTDVLSSLVVLGALLMTARPADEEYPYGYGKAESVAGAIVSLMLFGAAVSIVIVSVREILQPRHTPAPFTLVVAGAVVVTKEILFRKVLEAAKRSGSTAVTADAWHHRSDVVSSAAAFIGISLSLLGGPHWGRADSYAAIVAAAIIAINAARLIRPAMADLMDRMPSGELVQAVEAAAKEVRGVCAIEKLRIRKLGLDYYVDVHVQAAPELSLHDAHILSGIVKQAIRTAVPAVRDALIHMEPYEP